MGPRYSESSFTLTQTQGGKLSLEFYGSAITVFGGKRINHGTYMVQLDAGSVSSLNGGSSTESFQQTLYSGNETLGSHTMTITNTDPSRFFDLDYVSSFIITKLCLS